MHKESVHLSEKVDCLLADDTLMASLWSPGLFLTLVLSSAALPTSYCPGREPPFLLKWFSVGKSFYLTSWFFHFLNFPFKHGSTSCWINLGSGKGVCRAVCICSAVLKACCQPREGHLLTSEQLCLLFGVAPSPAHQLQMKERIAVERPFWGSLSPAWGFIHYWEQTYFSRPLLSALILPTWFRMSAQITFLQRNLGPARKLQKINYLLCLIIGVQIY